MDDYFTSDQAATVKKKIIYEQPLNERMRMWLRLEYLFSCIDYHAKGPHSWESRAAMTGIIEVLEFIGRSDLKPDLIKELENQQRLLSQWKEFPGVDLSRLNLLLDKLSSLLDTISGLEGQFGKGLQSIYLVNLVRQRSHIPGGTCRFDLPGYYHWLQKMPKQRQADLLDWLNHLLPLRDAVELILYLMRQRAIKTQEIAEGGFYQAKLEGQQAIEMVRIILSGGENHYPEISGGKHRFTIRFFECEQVHAQPQISQSDIEFELCRCA